jgi:uracil-DNA glycosylase
VQLPGFARVRTPPTPHPNPTNQNATQKKSKNSQKIVKKQNSNEKCQKKF